MPNTGGENEGTTAAPRAGEAMAGCSPASLSSPMSSGSGDGDGASSNGAFEPNLSLDKFMETLDALSPDGEQLHVHKRQVCGVLFYYFTCQIFRVNLISVSLSLCLSGKAWHRRPKKVPTKTALATPLPPPYSLSTLGPMLVGTVSRLALYFLQRVAPIGVCCKITSRRHIIYGRDLRCRSNSTQRLTYRQCPTQPTHATRSRLSHSQTEETP